ncbi:unnamed protein product [Eruca vesicaria subsp. sativa]|uniref:Uncharacterized protein n=1 Tax=Eruca vesicaria subsp. sativa TaxID=29727 RepID=A0ABC8LH71_ERUVS|nr:unnamed protein product [Eruca vesicaria subsp. sativa]
MQGFTLQSLVRPLLWLLTSPSRFEPSLTFYLVRVVDLLLFRCSLLDPLRTENLSCNPVGN